MPQSSSDEAAGRISGRPFPKGVSGNPAGRPKGARGRRNILLERLMCEDFESLSEANKNLSQAIGLYFDQLTRVSRQDADLGVKLLIAISKTQAAAFRCAAAEFRNKRD